MAANQNSDRDANEEKYARLWFAGLVKFHNIKDAANWEFDEKHVISFLREKLAAKMLTWKRFKIVEGLIWYRFGSTGAGSTRAIGCLRLGLESECWLAPFLILFGHDI